MDEESIFVAALAKEPQERAVFLDEVCAGDAHKRKSVESLLLAHEEASEILEAPHAEFELTMDSPPVQERAGMTIGNYKLLEEIGEGGFGIVFMAEQRQPLRRKVALKVIKPGMDTREVVARFEIERQALAMMDHPNIAKVFDAGATDSGRPYFVMELVRGIPITEYCDQNNLTAGERLGLFITVCQAVQHAHQKGIIHRDIKPSNVLVTLHDGTAVPKVIDFGVAKAINQRLTEKTLFTRFAQIVGTPLYMSPEQAEMSGLDVDTRSDIYSLGVLLYELLTGTPPFDRERLQHAAFDEIRRIIRDEEPPKPSTKVSTLGEKATAICDHRKTNPKKLSALIRGDLDWIVMKALEKDRTRRYETANGLANDIQRYLDDEPVSAGPPSVGYRFRKFARRNKVALVTTMFVAVVLLASSVVSTCLAIWAIKAERQATASAQRAETNFEQAMGAVDEMLREVAESDLKEVPYSSLIRRRLLKKAAAFCRQLARQQDADPAVQFEVAKALLRLGTIHFELDEHDASRDAYDQSLATLESLSHRFSEKTTYQRYIGEVLIQRGELRTHRGKHTQAESDFARAISTLEELIAEDGSQHHRFLLSRALLRLGNLKKKTGKMDEALEHYTQVETLALRLSSESGDNPKYRLQLAKAVGNQATILSHLNRGGELVEVDGRVVQLSRELATAHPNEHEYRIQLGKALGNAAVHLISKGEPKESQRLLSEAIALSEEIVGKFPLLPSYRRDLARYYNTVSMAYMRDQQNEKAEQCAAKGVDVLRTLTDRYPDIPDYRGELAATLHNLAIMIQSKEMASGKTNAAELERVASLLEEAISNCQSALNANPNHPVYRQFLGNHFFELGRTMLQMGDYSRAGEMAATMVAMQWSDPSHYDLALYLLIECEAGVSQKTELSEQEQARLAADYRDRIDKVLQAGIDKHPKSAPELWLRIGQAHYSAGNYERVTEVLEETLSFDGCAAGAAMFVLAMAHAQLGHKEESQAWYDKAKQTAKDNTTNAKYKEYSAKAADLIGQKIDGNL